MAAQFTLMNGPFARVLSAWMVLRDQLLARAVFADDQAVGVGGGDVANHLEHRVDAGVAADDGGDTWRAPATAA